MDDGKTIQTCSIWRALDIMGDGPIILIMESAFLRVTRFEGFLASTGMLRTLLSNRLKKLVDAECMEKVAYSKKPLRYEYRLTDKGRSIYSGALMMLRWEKKWGQNIGKIDIKIRHKTCGQACDPIPECGSCHQEIDFCDVRSEEGSGMAQMQIAYQRRRRQSGSTQKRQNETTLLDTMSDVIGDRWSMLILRACFNSIDTFDEIRADCGMATNVLADRLKTLIERGILEKHAYQQKPTRYHYTITKSGLDIYPIQLELIKWGDRYYAGADGPPVLLYHKSCNSRLVQQVSCSFCGDILLPEDVDFEVSEPGFADIAAKKNRIAPKEHPIQA